MKANTRDLVCSVAILLGMAMVAGCSSGGSSSTTSRNTTGQGAAPTLAAPTPTSGAGTNGYGRPVSVTSDQGYQYTLAASRFTMVAQPSGAEPAPPGQTYVTFSLVVSNPLSDRSEPVTAFDRGAGQAGWIDLATPLDTPGFNCSNSAAGSPATIPTNPPSCNTDAIAVAADSVSDSGMIRSKGLATVVYATEAALPSTTDLSHLKIYFWDQGATAAGVAALPGPVAVPQPPG